MDIEQIVARQREYFNGHQTFDVNFRKEQLRKLKLSIRLNLPELMDAFRQDLNKTEYDVYLTELSLVVNELNYLIKNLDKLAKPRKKRLSIVNLGSKGTIVAEPYGVTLIVSPWNYPFQLAMLPVIGAIAAGNTVVLKPSSATPNIGLAIKKILGIFKETYVAVVIGDRQALDNLFDQKFDFAFFTGGTSTAKILQEKLSKNLTPSILELGGKSPCIIDYDADIALASKRAVWGKYLNAGQTCVAPDYFLVHETIKQEFIDKCIAEIKAHYYYDDTLSQDFVHIVNEKQFERITKLIDYNKVVFGGKAEDKTIEPTIIDNVSYDDAIMQEEIFGPIMPIISFSNVEEVVEKLSSMERPLALYYFGTTKEKQEYIMNNTIYGGGCINDTLVHVTEHNLPFGGIGNSGMGQYHGKKTFDAFTHYKSVLVNNGKFDLKLKYMPYTSKKLKTIKKFYKV